MALDIGLIGWTYHQPESSDTYCPYYCTGTRKEKAAIGTCLTQPMLQPLSVNIDELLPPAKTQVSLGIAGKLIDSSTVDLVVIDSDLQPRAK